MIFLKCRQRKCRLLALFFLALLVALTLGYFTPVQWRNHSNENGSIAIYVSNSGIHTDILVPVKTPLWNWQEAINFKSIVADTDSVRYLGFGFGDRSYFLETSRGEFPKLSTIFNALFLPTPPAMRVLFYRGIPQNLPAVKCVIVSNFNYLKLVNFINNSFQLNRNNQKNIIEKLPNNRGSFYKAKGSYSILRGCNDWTAEALKNAGLNTPVWSGLSSAIMWHLKSNC